MNIYHNSQNITYRSPFGACPVGTAVTLRLDISETNESAEVFLQTLFNDIRSDIRMMPSECEGGLTKYTVRLILDETPGVLWYKFRIETQSKTLFYGNNDAHLGGCGRIYEGDVIPYQITVYKKDTVPSWYTDGIVYQIFPDRFARGNGWEKLQEKASIQYCNGLDVQPPKRPLRRIQDNWEDTPIYPRGEKAEVTEWIFAGGNLNGIRKKLSYLKDLGVTVLYLNPIFRASSNHKYDTFDYTQIDDAFGDENDFKLLCSEAGKMGIRIILDGVFNHTGADSIYFNFFGRKGLNGACQGQSSQYYSWFTFTEDGYESWWGVGDLPNVRESEETYQNYIYKGKNSIVRKWLRLGASGWRLDVADELPDEFIAGIRTAMREEGSDNLLMGEVWEDASNKEAYGILRKYFQGDELQSTMNYPFRTSALAFINGNISAGEFAALLMSLKENYPKENFYANLNLIGSHDRARSLTELSDSQAIIEGKISNPDYALNAEEQAFFDMGCSRPDAIKAAFTIPEDKLRLAKDRLKALSMLQFVMPGVPCIYYGDEAGMQGWEDPFNRGSYPWGQEDRELMEHYKMLCRLRKDYPILISGDFLPYACSEHVICFERFTESERFWLFVNRGIFEWETITINVTGQEESLTLAPLEWSVFYQPVGI